ncbi:hypothetical protein MKZ38_000546 [Zalerion maritima]|uniref:Uncharacterized protein n=1 Tax=Zalerion maritima TaxID=339359 RepID=A0AAD5WUL2_9PEZI|nr:hypothetical protein MKZ38_000546 [Zalerion maritima]
MSSISSSVLRNGCSAASALGTDEVQAMIPPAVIPPGYLSRSRLENFARFLIILPGTCSTFVVSEGLGDAGPGSILYLELSGMGALCKLKGMLRAEEEVEKTVW